MKKITTLILCSLISIFATVPARPGDSTLGNAQPNAQPPETHKKTADQIQKTNQIKNLFSSYLSLSKSNANNIFSIRSSPEKSKENIAFHQHELKILSALENEESESLAEGIHEGIREGRGKNPVLFNENKFNYQEDWNKSYSIWISNMGELFLFYNSCGWVQKLCARKDGAEIVNRLLSSNRIGFFDKSMFYFSLENSPTIQHVDEDSLISYLISALSNENVLLWTHNTTGVSFHKGKTSGKFLLPTANLRFCDLAAKLINIRYFPDSLKENNPDNLQSLAIQECGYTEKLTTWPGWKKMPAMQDAYVAKAKAWLDDYKKKRAAAAALRELLRNPQAAHLDAKTWQTSWEALVLLETKTPGFNDQRFDLLAEAFLREAMNPKAQDRQMRQSCILGQLQQMWVDAKQTTETPSPDTLVKPQAALDFLEASLKQLTPPLAQDPTAKTIWEYKVKDWRKEWNTKLDAWQKEAASPPPKPPK